MKYSFLSSESLKKRLKNKGCSEVVSSFLSLSLMSSGVRGSCEVIGVLEFKIWKCHSRFQDWNDWNDRKSPKKDSHSKRAGTIHPSTSCFTLQDSANLYVFATWLASHPSVYRTRKKEPYPKKSSKVSLRAPDWEHIDCFHFYPSSRVPLA